MYGPGERDLHTLFRSTARGWVPMIGADDRTYSIVHARDLAAAILAVVAVPAAAGQVYYVAEPRAYAGRELLEHVAAAIGRKPRVVRVPQWVAACVARGRLRAQAVPEQAAPRHARQAPGARAELGVLAGEDRAGLRLPMPGSRSPRGRPRRPPGIAKRAGCEGWSAERVRAASDRCSAVGVCERPAHRPGVVAEDAIR